MGGVYIGYGCVKTGIEATTTLLPKVMGLKNRIKNLTNAQRTANHLHPPRLLRDGLISKIVL